MKAIRVDTNFKVPKDLRLRFDRTCRASGKTRTSVLVQLMEEYIISQGPILAERNARFEEADRILQETQNHITSEKCLYGRSWDTKTSIGTRGFDDEPLDIFGPD